MKTKLNTKGITKPLISVLQLHPKRQTQGPKKRFIMGKHLPEKLGGTELLPLSRENLEEAVTVSCHAVHHVQGEWGKMEASGAG